MTNAQQLKDLQEQIDMLKSVVVFLAKTAYPLAAQDIIVQNIKRRLGIEE